MALTKSDIPDLLLPGLKAEFDLAYRQQVDHSVVSKIATVIQTTMPVQRYAWLGATPPMREFVDERRPAGLGSYAMTLEDKVFESSIAVDRRAIEDDQLDLIRLRVREMANRVEAHRHQLVVQTLIEGFTANGYDGVSFFNTAHPIPNGATYGNRVTDALGATALGNAISQMMLTPDDSGMPLGIVPDTLVVGPKLQWSAMELVESPVVVFRPDAPGDTGPTPFKNVFQGRLNLVVSPFLSGAADDYWFLLDTSRPIRGLILQQRSDVPVEFSALEGGSGSEVAFMQDRYFYGVRGRYNVGYGLWQAALGSIVA